MAGLVVGTASAATMTQLINGPSDIRVAPLVEASWAQGDVNGSPCYNSKTPHNYVCGCVATAAGEIMRRWQYPAAASVRRTNTCSTNGVEASFTMIGGPNVAYDWANMPFKPEGEASLSTAQREAIGTLLYDIGVAAGMDWTSNGSSSSTSIMVDQFTSVFGYSNAAIAGNPSGTGLSLEQFTQAVLPSLDAGMPVIVGIGGSNTQHSAICDGYGYQDGDLYIHINMGNAIDSESSVEHNNTWYKFPTAVMNISTKEYTSGNGVSLWPNGEQSYLNPVVYNISPTMQKGWSIVSGRILSGETVVEGAEVVAVNASGEGVAKATSNAKGIYAIALPAGTYTLRAVDSDETKGARVSVTVVATAGTRDGATATGVVIGNQHGVDIALADIGRDFFASETPDEYLDYVATDGSAYIDTGVIGKAGTKADIGMMWHGGVGTKDVCFLGARNGSTGRFLLCHAYGGNWNLAYRSYYTSSAVVTNPKPADDTFYSVQSEIDETGVYKITVNGKSYTHNPNSGDTGYWSSTFSMYLFALQGQESGTANNKSPAGTRCYWTKIWQLDDGGAYKLVRDFAPCKKGGVAGLYDKVSKTIFYPVTGSGTLTAGNTLSTVAEPDAYLDYVESDGNQYIDTGVIGKDGTKVEMSFIHADLSGGDVGHVLLGSSAGSAANMCYMPWCRTYNSYYRAMTGYNARYQYIYWKEGYSAIYTNTSYVLSCNVTTNCHYKATLNGYDTEYDYTANGPLDTRFTMYAFAANDSGTAARYAKAKLYYLKIWQTDANGDEHLLRDFVPCRKDGVAGLYDKVSKSIFVSKGSKPLIAGPVSSVVEEPDEFLDYVESNGNQYIDTGVVGKFGTRAEMKFNANSDNGSGVHLLGACVAGSTYFHFCYFGSKLNAGFGSETWNYAWPYNKGITYELESGCSLDKKVWLNLGTDLSGTQTVSGATDSGLNLYAFARNNGGFADGKCSVKLYTMKIWQTDANGNENLLRDFVPCRKDGEPGLYDKVTKSIFYSRGTQPFIAGSLPGYPDEILDYVEATGAQYVDTGVVGKSGTKVNLNIEPTATSESYFLASRSGSERFLFFYLYSNKINVGYRNKYNAKNFGTCSTGKRYNLTADIVLDGSAINATCTADGTALSATSSSWTSGRIDTGLNMYMFSLNWDGAAYNYFKGKCYGVKIWQIPVGGTEYVLVCDFVPCKKDGVAGLWDRVTKKIFYSKTSTALVAGNTIAKVGTPDSFVEYVESSGTQYIDTGVLGKAGTKSEAKMMWLESGKDWVFLGAKVDSGDTRFNLVQTYKGGFGYGYGIFQYWSAAKADAETPYTVETEYTSTSKKLVVNGNTWMNGSATAFNADIPLYMFAMNYNGTASNIAKARCYSVTIDQVDGNGDYQPKRNFAPCVKGGKAALYDSVTGMIYYPQGGDLTASENEASVTSAQWIGGTVTSAADLANAANWKCWQAGLVVYGKAPVTVSEGVATLTCPVTLDVAADWSAAGVITLASGATVDLNGHVLATAGFALAEGQTVSVLKNLPKGWKVKKSTDGRTLTIVKIKGVMIIAK